MDQGVQIARHDRLGAQCAPRAPLHKDGWPPELHQASRAAFVRCSKLLFEEGEAAGDMFLIDSGTVKLFRSLPDGRRQVVGFPSTGDLLGAPFSDPLWSYSAQALTHCRVQVLSRNDFQRLVLSSSVLERYILEVTSRQLDVLREHVLLLGCKTADEKLACFLIMMAARRPRPLDEPRVSLPMSRADIGEFLGLTSESVSRAFTRFRTRGLIRLQEVHKVELLRPETLADLAAAGSEPAISTFARLINGVRAPEASSNER